MPGLVHLAAQGVVDTGGEGQLEISLVVLAIVFPEDLLGFAEEFAYRGYSQATLAEGMGFWRAAPFLSAIFGAVHYFFKPMENWMDGLSVGIFGLFWCFTLRRTGTLWFAIGFHAMSDYADMVLFAQPNTGNSGQSLTGHLLNVSYHGPEWLTGGPRGTEASALEFLILAFMFLAFARAYPRIKAQPVASDEELSRAPLT